jgi:hypothetical protein
MIVSKSNVPYHPDSEKFRGSPSQSHCSLLIPLRNTEIHSNEESHTPTSLRYRENIGRIGSLRVF